MSIKRVWLWAAALAAVPGEALAGGIGEFTEPLEKVVNTITGPVAKSVAIVAIALCGYQLLENRHDMSDGFKMLLKAVVGIAFMPFARPIINTLFSFTEGALI